MHKFTKTCCLTLLSLTLNQTCFADIDWHNYLRNFYLGIGITANTNHYHDKYTFNPLKVNNTVFYNRKNSDSESTNGYMLELGYMVNCNPYAMGLSFSLFEHQHDSMFSDYALTNKFNLSNRFTAALKGGRWIREKSFIYAMAGMSYAELKRRVNFGGDFAPLGLAPLSATKRKWFPSIGLGWEYAYNENWRTALEVTHQYYSEYKYSLQHSIFKFLGAVGKNKVDLSQDTFTFKILYYMT